MAAVKSDERRVVRRGVTAGAIVLLSLAAAALLVELNRPPAVAEVTRHDSGAVAAHRIDINTAPAYLLQTLPGIGPKLAERIIEDRNANGPFEDIAGLERVKGIGPRTVARLEDLAVASEADPTSGR